MKTNTFLSNSVPFLPVLGPVHPDEMRSELLRAIYDSSQQNKLLPYDKATRWRDLPDERIVENGITATSSGQVIITETKLGARQYIYGDAPWVLDPEAITFTFSESPIAREVNEACTAIFLDSYKSGDEQFTDEHIVEAHILSSDLRVQVGNIGEPGLKMLVERDLVTSQIEPTLIYVKNGRVLGAIGPCTILKDSRGVKRLLPCYFGVLPSARRQGVGSALWRAVRAWASKQGAHYKIFQAEQGSPAEAFYRDQNLKCLGYVRLIKPGPTAG